jgi:hypothetical protein
MLSLVNNIFIAVGTSASVEWKNNFDLGGGGAGWVKVQSLDGNSP